MRGAHSARTFRTVLRGIGVPSPFCLEAFAESVGERRGRLVVVAAVPSLGPGWRGAWLATRAADVIFHPASVSGVRRDQVAVHHLSHMLLGHRARPVASLAGLVAPAAGERLAELMLGGQGPDSNAPYADQEEQAADEMSMMILARADRGPRPAWRAPGRVPAARGAALRAACG